MKALSFASILVLSVAGTACSQAQDSPAEVDPPATETVDSQEEFGGSFNLGLPTDVETAATDTSGFNLDLPTTDATSTDGFNLGTDIPASNGLEALPEIDPGLVEETASETPVDEEPVIRLD